MYYLLSDYFYKDPFTPLTVKFAIKYTLPGAKIKFPICNCNNHFTPHYLSFHVRISIILANIMSIL